MFEKRRRRRESHNAVERRRRDNINDRINGNIYNFDIYIHIFNNMILLELCTLLPERLLDTAPTSSNVMSVSSGQAGANGRTINKGTILKLSVDHIKDLRDEVSRYQDRIRELEHMIELAKRGELIIKPEPTFDTNNNTNNNNNLFNNSRGHQRMGSIQFRQQFNNLQIGANELQ